MIRGMMMMGRMILMKMRMLPQQTAACEEVTLGNDIDLLRMTSMKMRGIGEDLMKMKMIEEDFDEDEED